MEVTEKVDWKTGKLQIVFANQSSCNVGDKYLRFLQYLKNQMFSFVNLLEI